MNDSKNNIHTQKYLQQSLDLLAELAEQKKYSDNNPVNKKIKKITKKIFIF